MAKPPVTPTSWWPSRPLDEDFYTFRAGAYGQFATRSPGYLAHVQLPPDPREATDGELQEAADPTTPGERLVELYGVRWRESDVLRRLARNPSLPWPELRRLLTWRLYESLYGSVVSLDAWHNPALPLYLMATPDPELLEHARRLLWQRTLEVLPVSYFKGRLPRPEPLGLPALVGALGRLERDVPPDMHRHRHTRELLALARHLAGLFGLPWPSDAP